MEVLVYFHLSVHLEMEEPTGQVFELGFVLPACFKKMIWDYAIEWKKSNEKSMFRWTMPVCPTFSETAMPVLIPQLSATSPSPMSLVLDAFLDDLCAVFKAKRSGYCFSIQLLFFLCLFFLGTLCNKNNNNEVRSYLDCC